MATSPHRAEEKARLMYTSFWAEIGRGETGRPWVARLLGHDPKYRYKREFVNGLVDYSTARFRRSLRHCRIYWTLPEGVYEVNEPLDPRDRGRYFIRVANGDYDVITREEVDECLKSVT